MLFSQRKRAERGEFPLTSFSYDVFPKRLRNQLSSLLGNSSTHPTLYSFLYKYSFKIIKYIEEKDGLVLIGQQEQQNTRTAFVVSYSNIYNTFHPYENYLKAALEDSEVSNTVDEILFTILELCLQQIERDKQKCKEQDEYEDNDRKLKKINNFLHENGVGYAYKNGRLTPIDDKNIETYFVDPSISVLSQPPFTKSYDVYIKKAFEFFREKKFSDAVKSACDGCECILKIILEEEEGKPSPIKGYKQLIEKVVALDIIAKPSDNGKSPLLNAITAELAHIGELRNAQGGHGEGNIVAQVVTAMDAQLAIHHALANMIYVVRSYEKFIIAKASKKSLQ